MTYVIEEELTKPTVWIKAINPIKSIYTNLKICYIFSDAFTTHIFFFLSLKRFILYPQTS